MFSTRSLYISTQLHVYTIHFFLQSSFLQVVNSVSYSLWSAHWFLIKCFPCISYEGPEDHFEVMSLLISVVSRWKHIGGALRIRQDVLEAIQQSYGDRDQSEAMSQVISKWLRQTYNVEKFGKPSWKMLNKAVAHELGGADRHTAEEIAKIYEHPRIVSVSKTLPCRLAGTIRFRKRNHLN